MTTPSQPQSNTTAELLPDLYSNAFSSLQPRRAHNILIGRLKSAKSFNEELADYFKDRCAIEDQYVKSLLKLSKKPGGIFNLGLQTSSTSTNEEEELSGGIGKIKELLQSELIDVMDAHSKLLTKVQTEVEDGFRNCKVLSHPNWTKVRSLEDNLNITIKNYEDFESKLNKSQAKLDGTTNMKKIQNLQIRLSEDQKNLDHAKQLYLDQAPMIYQSYQTFDNTRLINLVETLTKFETLQADHSREKMEIFERSMMNLLNFDCREEMQRFALRNGTINPTLAGAVRGSRSSSGARQNRQPTATPPGSQQPHNSSTATSPPHTRARASGDGQLASSPDQSHPIHPNPTTEPQSSVRLSLEASSRNPLASSTSTSTYDPNHASIPKLSTPNISIPIRSDTPETASAAPPSRDLYVQRQNSVRSISRIYRSGSSNNISRLHPNPSSTSINQTPKPSASHSIADKFFNKSRFAQMLSRSTGATSGPLRQRTGTNSSQANRSTMYESGAPDSANAQPSHARSSSLANSNSVPNQASLYGELETEAEPALGRQSKRLSKLPMIPMRKTSRSAPSLPPTLQSSDMPPLPSKAETPRLDAEGFTIPPEDRDRKPWEMRHSGNGKQIMGEEHEGMQALEGTGNEISNSDDIGRPNSTLAGLSQFSIKPSSPDQLNESESERQAAIQKVQNTLTSVSLGSALGGPGGLGPTRRSATGLRGRRGDGRGVTMYDTSSSSQPGPLTLHRASTVSRENSTDNVPLSVVRAAKAMIPQQAKPLLESPQEVLFDPSPTIASEPTGFQTSFVSSPVETELVVPNSNPQPSPSYLIGGSDPSQGQSAGEEPTRHLVRTNSVYSSLSTTGGGAFGQGASTSGTNPFLSRSFSPSISSPTFTYNPPGSMTGRLEEAGQKVYSAHGLTAVVKETLNVLMDVGLVTKVLLLGELRLVWPSIAEQQESGLVRFKVVHHDRLEKVLCTSTAVSPGSEPGEYVLDAKTFKLAEEAQAEGKSMGLTVLKYRIYLDSKATDEGQARKFVPLQVIPHWRAQRARTELMLVYEPNPVFHRFEGADDGLESNWTLEDLGLSTKLYNPDATSINPRHVVRKVIMEHQEIPTGVWDEKSNEMRWALAGLGAQAGSQRVIGRFIHPEPEETEAEMDIGSIEFTRANCGPVQVRWKMQGTSVSGIELKIVQNEEELGPGHQPRIERFEEVVKTVVTGTFLAR
ncbi:hypothetical protein CROQUDRAFT_101730 [Cronartium quercuum f. sp. fusiforme G11]|uniref:MHD domain-containing protein n=1 Tax=Cronartium quercuum f. sp. fusiforme G11 TaxID=708437 RepID=A0A9P6N8R1_9BASI|nr:hypothetical protein CROQUDRAFT_101730 [Cronartium quercuum f. sp. fusiforme G11]